VDKTPEYGTSTSAPWRAGANENTTIEFSTPVKVEGKDLPAGTYGFFVAYGPQECTLIFSKDHNSWGNYFYDEKNDALRVKVKPVALSQSVEWLKYEFTGQTDNSATIALQWEKVMIPFKVSVDLVQTQLADYREELKGSAGFRWESWEQAAGLCLANNTNLQEGLGWADIAVSSHKDFTTLSTRAGLLEKSGQQKRADSLMKSALDIGSMQELHQYGRQLVGMKKTTEALDVFKLNAKKNPKQFTTYVGLARGYSAAGDYKNALANAKAALPLAPNELNKQSVAGMIKKLEGGQDIN
jgi:tetratricopeptide (TPR) repeat protein